MNAKKQTRVEKLKEEMRKEYINCAKNIFQEKGFKDTHIKDITDMAGTSVGNFYNYFNSKEDLFEELMNSFANSMLEKLSSLLKYDIPPIPKIQELFSSYIDDFKGSSESALIYLEQMGGINQKFREMKNKLDYRATLEIKKIIDKLLKLKIIPKQNSELTSRIWLGGIYEAYRWWVYTGFKMDQEELATELAYFLSTGTVGKRFP